MPRRHWGVPPRNDKGLLYRFGGVVVVMGFAILFFQEVNPIGRSVVKEVGEYPVGGPDPAKVLIPQPKVSSLSMGGVHPTEFGMIEPGTGEGTEGTKPGGCAPSFDSFWKGIPPVGFGLGGIGFYRSNRLGLYHNSLSVF